MKLAGKIILVLPLMGLILMGCEKNKWDREMAALDAYLVDNDIETAPTSSGIYYIETLKGSGPDASGGDYVTVKYKGTFLDGEEFDSGTYSFTLGVGQVIPGWDEGINYMREGGKAILIIPSTMAYGSSGRNSIPGYSTLIFEVELKDLQ